MTKISHIARIICLFAFIVQGAYDPDKFYIGAWGGPILTGASRGADSALFKSIQDDNYNLIFCDLYNAAPFCQPNVILPGAAGLPVSNLYRLNCLAGLSLQTCVFDQYALGHSIECFDSPFSCSGGIFFRENSVKDAIRKNYSSLPQNLQDRMIGYFLGDEPGYGGAAAENMLAQIGRIDNFHPGMIGFVNLLPYESSVSPSDYMSYLSKFSANSNVKVLCFAVYPILNNRDFRPFQSQYWWGKSAKIFWNYERMISGTRDRPGLKFWAVIEGSRPDPREYAPNRLCASYCLNTALIYGAKGIIWYTWYNWSVAPEQNPPVAADTTAVYHIAFSPMRDTIRALNAGLAGMSGLLTQLEWVKTVHGKFYDPQTRETDLPTTDQETSVLKMPYGSLSGYIAIGVFKKDAERYLMVFNKDLNTENGRRTPTISVNGIYTPAQCNAAGKWTALAFSRNLPATTTTFTLSLDHAEMQLIRLTNRAASFAGDRRRDAGAPGLADTLVSSLAVSGGGTLFAGTLGAGVFRSTDNGARWTRAADGITNCRIRSIAANGDDIFAGSDAGLFRSADNGAHWTRAAAGITDKSIRSIVISGRDLYAAGEDGVFRSTDNGTNWTAAAAALTDSCVVSLNASGGALFAWTAGGGAFRSTDKGARWTAVPTDLRATDAWAFAVAGSAAFPGTFGGAWPAPSAELPGLSEPYPGREIIRRLRCSLSPPGRFGGAILVAFDLLRPAQVSITLYDPAGRKAASIVDRRLAAGSHRYSWDARLLAQGCYAIRLRAGSTTRLNTVRIVR